MAKGVATCVIGLLSLILFLGAGLMLVTSDEEDRAVAGSLGVDLTAVPEAYRGFITAAGNRCAEVPASLIAAQIEAESAWNPTAVSPVGAQGLTQFMPATWAAYGIDGDGDGIADPFGPADAIASQANYMCTLVNELRDLAESTDKDLIDLILAGYNAGPGAVTQYGGVPPYAETQGYVAKIKALMRDKYGAIDAGGSTSGGWIDPVPNPVRGTPFRKYGSSWAWKGWHTGVDYPAPIGTRIGSAGPGTVSEIKTGGSYGLHVIVDHGSIDGKKVQSLYAHMSAFAAGLEVGDRVQPNTALGYVGLTGNTSGPHLHLEVHLNWTGGSNDAEFTDPWAWIDAHRAPANSGGDAAEQRTRALTFARDQLGVPYSWGGGGLTAPGKGFGPGANTVGWDCSSLVRAAVYAGSAKVTLPRVTQDQAGEGEAVNGTPQIGDLVFFRLNGTSYDHVGIATGKGTMIHAPRTGKDVEEVSITTGYYADKPQTVRRVL